MALLCKNFKPESQVVWIWEAFLPLCNLVVDIVYVRSYSSPYCGTVDCTPMGSPE